MAAKIGNVKLLTLTLLMWRIVVAPNNASKWQMGFNLASKEIKTLWEWAKEGRTRDELIQNIILSQKLNGKNRFARCCRD
jgi:hypothetical protein